MPVDFAPAICTQDMATLLLAMTAAAAAYAQPTPT
jgi:hypothetical protein